MAYTTLKNNWKSYSEHCVHPLTQAIQRDEVERGYYAGVAMLLGLIKQNTDILILARMF